VFFFFVLLLFARLFFLVSSSSLVPHPSLPEHRPVQDVPDRPVGRLPHLLQLELLDARLVGRDRRALDADAVLQDGVGGVDRHLVVGGVAVREPQVVVLDGEVEVGEDELLLDLGPDDAGGFFFSFSGSFFFRGGFLRRALVLSPFFSPFLLLHHFLLSTHRVISSPSRSTTGLATLILVTGVFEERGRERNNDEIKRLRSRKPLRELRSPCFSFFLALFFASEWRHEASPHFLFSPVGRRLLMSHYGSDRESQ